MAFPIIGDFDERDFDEEIYPPYKNIVKDIENMSEFVHIRSDFKVLRVFIKEIHEQLDQLENYVYFRDYKRYGYSIYAILGKIEDLIEAIDETIGRIKIKIKKVPGYQTFEYYISRVQLEVTEPILMDIKTFEHYIEQRYDISAELPKFIESTRKALREAEKMIDEVLKYT
jgi:hypothetical protein